MLYTCFELSYRLVKLFMYTVFYLVCVSSATRLFIIHFLLYILLLMLCSQVTIVTLIALYTLSQDLSFTIGVQDKSWTSIVHMLCPMSQNKFKSPFNFWPISLYSYLSVNVRSYWEAVLRPKSVISSIWLFFLFSQQFHFIFYMYYRSF